MTGAQTSPERIIQNIYIWREAKYAQQNNKGISWFRFSVFLMTNKRGRLLCLTEWQGWGRPGTSRDSQDGRWCTRGIRLDEARRSYRPGKGNERESDGRWRQEENARMMINFGLRGDTAKQNCFPYETGLKKKGLYISFFDYRQHSKGSIWPKYKERKIGLKRNMQKRMQRNTNFGGKLVKRCWAKYSWGQFHYFFTIQCDERPFKHSTSKVFENHILTLYTHPQEMSSHNKERSNVVVS